MKFIIRMGKTKKEGSYLATVPLSKEQCMWSADKHFAVRFETLLEAELASSKLKKEHRIIIMRSAEEAKRKYAAAVLLIAHHTNVDLLEYSQELWPRLKTRRRSAARTR